MESDEVPSDLTSVSRIDQSSLPKEVRIQQLLRLRDRLREKYRKLEEREISDDDAAEEKAIEEEKRISAMLLKTLRRLADLGVGEYEEEGLKLLRGQRAPVVFKGSGHPILDGRLSKELTKKQAMARADFASIFLTPGHISKMIRVLRDEEINKFGRSKLPSKNSNAWTELLIKITTAIKLTVTTLRYGHPNAMLEGYLGHEEIVQLKAEKIGERAAPCSLDSVRQQFAAAEHDADLSELQEEDDTDEGSAEVDGDEEDEDEIGDEHEQMVQEAVLANFLDEEKTGKEQEERRRSRKSVQPRKITEQGTSSANSRPQVTFAQPNTMSSESDNCSSRLASNAVVFFDEDGGEVVPESENDAQEPTSSSIQIVDQMGEAQDVSSLNLSPEPPITPSLGEHNDLSPGVVENNENEQKKREVTVTFSESIEMEELLKPSWLTGKTANELAHNFVHCRPVDDEIQLVFETKDIEYEATQEEVPDKYKMKRVRIWLEMQQKPEIVDLDEVAVDGTSKAIPSKRPHSGKEMVELEEGEVVSEPPKRPKTEKPVVVTADIEVIDLD